MRPNFLKEMDRVAKLSGGAFFDANNAKALSQGIQQALAVRYDVLDAAGERVGAGLTGQEVKLPIGHDRETKVMLKKGPRSLECGKRRRCSND